MIVTRKASYSQGYFLGKYTLISSSLALSSKINQARKIDVVAEAAAFDLSHKQANSYSF